MVKRLLPSATLVERRESHVRWKVTWPSTPQRWGETFIGDVDVATGEMQVLTAVRQVPASSKVAERVMPIMRAAIERSSTGDDV